MPKNTSKIRTLTQKVKADPLTGRVPYVPVTGSFKDRYNILAYISSNPTKLEPLIYSIVGNNGDSVSFMKFLYKTVWSHYLRHNEVLVANNS